MENETQLFDVAVGELHRGINLVEASAGTGKTYAIAMLVLRFVTEQCFPIDTLLLVTFTRAATEELAARIRQRLAEAGDLLMGRSMNSDPTLKRWHENLTDRGIALQRIRVALNDIDRAAIFTIHGFCQRMLQDQALESGQLFDAELQPDVSRIRLQVVEDFWRRTMYALSPLQCGVITPRFDNPRKLLESVHSWPGHGTLIEPATSSLVEAGERVEQSYHDMALWWRQQKGVLYCCLQQLIDEKKVKTDFVNTFATGWLELDQYFEGKTSILPGNLHWLSRSGFAAVINGSKVRGPKKDALLAEMPLADGVVESFQAAADTFLLSFRVSFAESLVEDMDKSMRQENLMSYNDLIVRLHQGVKDPQGGALRHALRQRYRVALIDEFQDTDSDQWQIFSSVFATETYLYLIGDPKQAIYRFRGADINSYFLARASATERLTLAKNFRSHPGLVSEVNRLFQSRPCPFAYEETLLGFTPVLPGKKHEDGFLTRGGRPLENMVYGQLDQSQESKDGRWTSAKAASAIMHSVSAEIISLLDGDVFFHQKNEEKRPLQPHDIAILVRNNSHGEEYLQYLCRAGIPAVITSKKSVYQTEECRELYILLQSLARPEDIERFRRAMAISWFGLTGNQLYRCFHDEHLFSRWYAAFHTYAELWSSRGFLLMMKRLLHQEKIYITMSRYPLAERRIANINHLLEVIQDEESERMFTPVQTLHWLGDTIARREQEDELRLESDEEAVRIVTMHGAKGLEYPVVFCPYLWYRKIKTEKEVNGIYCSEKGMRIMDLGSDRFEERKKAVALEEFAEDLRLLYVAVTRARLRCYTFWCDMKGHGGTLADSFASPLGYLLFGGETVPFADQQQRLQSLTSGDGVGYWLLHITEEKTEPYKVREEEKRLQVRQLQRASLHTDRQMTSYSALASMSRYMQELDVKKTVSSEWIEFASLPAGASFGNVVHDVLERVAFKELLQPEKNRRLIEEICAGYGVTLEITLFEKLLYTVVTTPLADPGRSLSADLVLADIDGSKCIKEMAFYLHLEKCQTAELSRILAGERSVVALSDKTIEGYLTGFVDLIFEHQGRFYIADYKTNHLGDAAADYQGEALSEAMASHNYGLQYWLYTLVLHRHLSNFYPRYRYEKHFGGVFYLFVRGMGQQPGTGIYFDIPDSGKLEMLDACLGGRK